MKLKDHIITKLGGFTRAEIDRIERKAANRYEYKLAEKAAAEIPVVVMAHASAEELRGVQGLLGGDIIIWRNLLLKCRLGGQLLNKAVITDRNGEITAALNIIIKGGGEE